MGDTTYAIDARPVHLAVLGAVVCVALLALTVLVARRKAGAVVSPFVPVLALPFGGFPMFVYGTRKWAWGHYDARWAAHAFHDAMLMDAAAAAVGVGAGLAAILVVALRTDNHLRVVLFALPCAALGLSLRSAARHADSIYAVGYMPYYEVIGQRDMHVGRERDVPVALMRPPQRIWIFGMESGPQLLDEYTRAHWKGDETVHVRATAPGRVPFQAVAHDGPVTLTTNLHVRAVPERASPLLSLRVGDRFVYRVRARSSDGALLYFVTLAGSETVHELTIEVVGTRERDAFRTFVLEVRRADMHRFVEVVALGGETREYDAEHGTVGAPIVGFDGESSRPDPVRCSFALLGASRAVCQRGGRDADVPAGAVVTYGAASATDARRSRRGAKPKDEVGRPPVAFAAAAPATFERNTSSTAGSIVTALIAVATVGLVILPDGSSSSSYTLVSTRRGAEGAPEALPG